MLFRRRQEPGFRERMRTALWPRRSFARSFRYFTKRVLRVKASPHAVAGGVAMGVLAGFLPFFGFQFILAAIFAWLSRTNLLAALLGTAVSNPLTMPLILVATLEAGQILLGRNAATYDVSELAEMLMNFSFASLWEPVLKPMLTGAMLLGATFAALFYVLTRSMISIFHRRRRKRLAELARDKARTEPKSVENAVVGP